ncbi:MAG TPA: glutamyl-tRNA reductase, partial [Desulfatirhabdiaceae bacterium]|nr:glutamyl-tRNA reductase [Desulfatirhabdiaceae bacterium]
LPGLQNLTADDAGALQRMTQAMINKFLHDPTTYLKRNGCMGNRSLHLDVTRKLFNLDPE